MANKMVVLVGTLGLLGACESEEVFVDETCSFLPATITPSRVEIAVGDSARVTARAGSVPAHCLTAADKQFLWRVNSASTASVAVRSDSTAVVKGLIAGETLLAVESLGGALSGSAPVIVTNR